MNEILHAQRLTWPELAEYLKTRSTVLVPIGAVEQHGAHLPLGTDTLLATRVAEDASARTGTIVYPPLWYGWSDHHMAYSGTVTLRPTTLAALVQDVARSLVKHGFRKLVFVNGHRRANIPPLQVALAEVQAESDATLAVADLGYLAFNAMQQLRRSEPGGMGHADEMETAQMLHLYPELVHLERARKNLSKTGQLRRSLLPSDPAHEMGDRVFMTRSIESFRETSSPDGLIGDPTVADEVTGRRFHAALVDNLVTFLNELEPL